MKVFLLEKKQSSDKWNTTSLCLFRPVYERRKRTEWSNVLIRKKGILEGSPSQNKGVLVVFYYLKLCKLHKVR